MKPNMKSGISLPFGKYGEIRFTKTVVRLSAKELPFHGENFDILREKLHTMCGFQNVVVEPDDEGVAINITLDFEVEGNVRDPQGLLRAVRKKLQRAMDQSYKCLHCMDRVLDYCPYCEKRKEAEALGDYLDRQGEMARHEEERIEALGDQDDDEGERYYCEKCGDPMDECVCWPDDERVCDNCNKPDNECTCELDDGDD